MIDLETDGDTFAPMLSAGWTFDAADPADLVEINLPDVPLRAFLDFQVHYRELRRYAVPTCANSSATQCSASG